MASKIVAATPTTSETLHTSHTSRIQQTSVYINMKVWLTSRKILGVRINGKRWMRFSETMDVT